MAIFPIHLSGVFQSLTLHGTCGIFRQTAVRFRIAGVVKHVNDVCPANARRIVYAGLGETGLFTKLSRAFFRELFHLRLGAEMQTTGRARLDAGWLEPLRDPVHAQRALEYLARRGAELRDIEGATTHAVSAANAMVLLEVHDAVYVLNDGAVGRTGDEAARLFAVHALVLAHEELQGAVFAFMFVELDQVPVVPLRFGHGLVGVVEGRFAEGEAIPLQTGNLAGLATDACGGIN